MKLEQIDTRTTAGKAEVMRLAAEGRRVAIRAKHAGGWHELDYPTWDWARDEFPSSLSLSAPQRYGYLLTPMVTARATTRPTAR